MASTRLLTPNSSSPFSNSLDIVLKAPITIGIIVTCMFHSFFFQFPGKVDLLILPFTLFQFYSVVSRDRASTDDGKIQTAQIRAEIYSSLKRHEFFLYEQTRYYKWIRVSGCTRVVIKETLETVVISPGKKLDELNKSVKFHKGLLTTRLWRKA